MLWEEKKENILNVTSMIGYKNDKMNENQNEVLHLTFVFDKIDLCPTYSPF